MLYEVITELTVKPLPEVNATGGVGEFIITTDISDSQVTPEDFFHYRVKISGQGNIPYIKFPEVEYSGLILIDKKESESIGYSDEGFLGWRDRITSYNVCYTKLLRSFKY